MPAFIRILKNHGHELTLFDVNQYRSKAVSDSTDCTVSNSIQELVKRSDTVIICTPISTIPGVVEEISSHAEKAINLVEISSIKNKSVAALKASPEHIRPLSVHPMFGPDVESFNGTTVIVVPVIDENREVKLAHELFTGAKIKVLNSETHDQSMAVILSLPYFMNSAFVQCIKDGQLPLLREIAGPTFKTQLALSECILGEDPSLVHSLIEDNVYARDILSQFIDELKYLRRMLKKSPGKLAGYYESSLEGLKADPDLTNARRLRDLFLKMFGR